MIDGILTRYSTNPIIVLMSDHGRADCEYLPVCHDILAAYLLPDYGKNPIYTGITSVNAFRAILGQYVGLEIEILEDEIYLSAG